jgi:hypothetical protein
MMMLIYDRGDRLRSVGRRNAVLVGKGRVNGGSQNRGMKSAYS